MTSNKYGGVIWTNHALERLEQRKISREDAIRAFNYPDKFKDGKKSGTKECIKKIGDKTVTLIVKENEHYEWVCLSAWIDPPLPGTKDAIKREKYHDFQRRYKKAGFWGRLWMDIFGN